jgi:ornithine decarboxylase
MSLVVRVDLRKKNILYINDGTHSFLRDAGEHHFIYPVKIFKKEEKSKLLPFSFYGPTCDSSDFMRGPFLLPESTNEGDYLEIEEMGAYSLSMKNNFNGFFSKPKIFIEEENK